MKTNNKEELHLNKVLAKVIEVRGEPSYWLLITSYLATELNKLAMYLCYLNFIKLMPLLCI